MKLTGTITALNKARLTSVLEGKGGKGLREEKRVGLMNFPSNFQEYYKAWLVSRVSLEIYIHRLSFVHVPSPWALYLPHRLQVNHVTVLEGHTSKVCNS